MAEKGGEKNSKYKIQNRPSAGNYNNNIYYSILGYCVFVRNIAANISGLQPNNFEFFTPSL